MFQFLGTCSSVWGDNPTKTPHRIDRTGLSNLHISATTAPEATTCARKVYVVNHRTSKRCSSFRKKHQPDSAVVFNLFCTATDYTNPL